MTGVTAALTIGPAVVGCMIASCFFGCSILQTYTYYKRFPADRRIFQLLVAVVMMLTFAHIVCIMYWTWTLTVTGFENLSHITLFSGTRDANLILTPIISTFVQIFFTYRLFILSKSKTLATFCIILSMLNLVGTLVDAVKAINYTAQNESVQDWLTILTLVAAAACDLAITIGLVYLLQRERKRTKVNQTQNIVDRLILWAIETGLATSMSAVLVTIFFCAMRNTFLWTAFYEVLADVYTNSLLAALNSREATRAPDTCVVEFSTFLVNDNPANDKTGAID